MHTGISLGIQEAINLVKSDFSKACTHMRAPMVHSYTWMCSSSRYTRTWESYDSKVWLVFRLKHAELILDVLTRWLVTVTLEWFWLQNRLHKHLESIGCLDMYFGKPTVLAARIWPQNKVRLSFCNTLAVGVRGCAWCGRHLATQNEMWRDVTRQETLKLANSFKTY